MVGERVILHSDLNAFFASVEVMLEPALREKAVAVCGSTETRHGIVLAKSELAKKAGVKTGQTNSEARRACPGLIMLPPQFTQYLKYSKLVKAIYQRYTDLVEPYGMDECWLDVTGSRIMGSGLEIAEDIRRTIKDELGLTVSIGVSFNKILAKLGSDLKKPDAVTVLDEANWKDRVWPLPVSELLYVGRATTKELIKARIYTIGELAQSDPESLRRKFGKAGSVLWVFANGLDTSRVMPSDYLSPIKSVGHGITCTQDLMDNEEVWKVMLDLSQDIGHKLRIHELAAKAVQITVKDNKLQWKQYQAQLPLATQSPMEVARKARELFEAHYHWTIPVRAVTVRAINLISKDRPEQLTFFDDFGGHVRREKLDATIDEIRRRFGKRSIIQASLMGDIKLPGHGVHEVTMPGIMYQ